MTLPETVAVCSLVLAAMVNIIFVARAWGKLSSVLEHLTVSVNELKATIAGVNTQANKHDMRITRLETIHESGGHRQHANNGGGSYTVETPVYRCPTEA
jgi:hypothetical protein